MKYASLFSSILIVISLNCYYVSTSVVELTSDNIDTYLQKYELVFINFYANW
jgi:hypothetical protein